MLQPGAATTLCGMRFGGRSIDTTNCWTQVTCDKCHTRSLGNKNVMERFTRFVEAGKNADTWHAVALDEIRRVEREKARLWNLLFESRIAHQPCSCSGVGYAEAECLPCRVGEVIDP